MGRHFTAEEQAAWLNSQPRKPMSSKVLLVDEHGSIFFTKPTYKPGWGLVGGMVDERESPLQAVLREVTEETGLVLAEDRLTFLGVRYGVSKRSGHDYLHFLFCARLTKEEIKAISTQEEEIEKSIWIAPSEADEKIDIQEHAWQMAKEALVAKRPVYNNQDQVVLTFEPTSLN